jgi:DNA-binding beta-propeller fold protein YncE
MRRLPVLVALGALVAASSSAGAAGPGRLPGVPAFRTCAAAGDRWPTETLAVSGRSAWMACKEQARVVRIDLARRRIVKSIAIGAPTIAVVVGYGAVWALDSSGDLARIVLATGRVVRTIHTGAGNPYNLWVGAGSVWTASDGTGEVLRVSPATNRVVARIPVGDGPADMVFDAGSAWVVNHRDRGLVRIDTGTNRPTRLATLPAEVPERIARLGGSLWVTGRGTDLLMVDPQTGATKASYEIGAGGIDVVAVAGALWVPSRNAAVDASGFPTMDALRRVSAGGQVTTVVHAAGPVDVHGLASAPGAVWLADNTNGVLYRVATG